MGPSVYEHTQVLYDMLIRVRNGRRHMCTIRRGVNRSILRNRCRTNAMDDMQRRESVQRVGKTERRDGIFQNVHPGSIHALFGRWRKLSERGVEYQCSVFNPRMGKIHGRVQKRSQQGHNQQKRGIPQNKLGVHKARKVRTNDCGAASSPDHVPILPCRRIPGGVSILCI